MTVPYVAIPPLQQCCLRFFWVIKPSRRRTGPGSLVLVGAVACGNNRFEGKFVWDLLKPAMSSAEIQILVGSRDAGYPMLHTIPTTGFSREFKAQLGFYADVEARCQVFHRCDQAGNIISYLCVNQTIFNQVTLVCDAWYNVECSQCVMRLLLDVCFQTHT
ncbi:hypothetical protein BV898_19379 [Hypsibius exemplaris]|uniref:Chitin-binding type-2 domain-containing protein n=1 Tax=Hypsibius exemplaris TaxID=2072580 RepID=A0A9X6RNW0_HYPEX|nr:hypothetical protein BV898_19379 [Hypsibius exemplaris]